VGLAGDVKLRRWLPLSLAASLAAMPAHGETCATEAEALAVSNAALAKVQGGAAAAQAALEKLDAFRRSTFDKYVYSEVYGYVSFLAEQARRTQDERLRTLYTRAAQDQFIRLIGRDLLFRQGWAEGVNPDVAEALMPRLAAEGCRIDAENLAWLKADLKQHGWPKKSVAGENADSAAWLITQHAVTDHVFMQEVLSLLEPLVAQGETEKGTYALLLDRVAYHDGRPQRYGSQGVCSAPHKWSPFPIDNPSDVDKRRSEMGLPPMAEYVTESSKSCP